MSLFNDTSDKVTASQTTNSLSENGIVGTVRNAVAGVTGRVTSITGGNPVTSSIGKSYANSATSAFMNQVGKYIPAGASGKVDVASRSLGDALSGNFNGAGTRLLESGLLNEYLPGVAGFSVQERYWRSPTPLFGGITPTDAKQLFYDTINAKRGRKNLWITEVSSALSGSQGRFNLLCTECEYAPNTITGERRRIGGTYTDALQSSEPVELRLTTFDDETGTLKKWFDLHTKAAVHQDGTVGLPGGNNGYAIRIKVVHGINLDKTGQATELVYYDVGYYRVANEEFSLSRREDGFQEVQMSFAQIETFMKVT